MDSINERLLDELNAKDDLGVKLGDTLDVKASIGLALITLLATQTAYFLSQPALENELRVLQFVSVAFLAVGTSLALVELWPRTYLLPVPETSGVSRIEELRKYYSQYEGADEATVAAQFISEEIDWAKTRISANQEKNLLKSKLLMYSYYFTAAAMVFNIATLVGFIQHPS